MRAAFSAQNTNAGKPPARALQAQPQGRHLQPLARSKATAQQMIAAQMKSIPRGPSGGNDNQAMFQAALRSAQFAPRGHGYYNAFANRCEHVLLGAAVGPATCIHGASLTTIPGTARITGAYDLVSGANLTISGTLTTNKKLVIFNPGSSDSTLGIVLEFVHPMQAGQSDPTVLDTSKISCKISQQITASQFSGLGPATQNNRFALDNLDGTWDNTYQSPGDRVESIPLRGSLRIKNVTENISVGGSVRVLRYNGSIRYCKDASGEDLKDAASGLAFSNPDVQTVLQLCDMIESSERTRHYNAKELLAEHQINTHPADFIRATTFEDDKHFDEAIYHTRYNTVLILIDDFASSNNAMGNTYELSCQVHRACRFSPGTVLHAKAQELGADPALAAKITALESQVGSLLNKSGTTTQGGH